MAAAATATPAAQQPVSADGVSVEVKPHKKKDSGYKVLCCGNSALDLVLIPLCLVFVYVLTGVLFALCTRAVLQTDDTATALWMFFGIYVAFIVMLGIVLAVTGYEKAQHQKHAQDASE